MVGITQPLLLKPQSTDCSSHLERQMEDDVTIDIEAMTKISVDGLLSPKCCIYKVPQQLLRDIKQDAYTPKVISIGPFHYDNMRLQEMEWHKKIFFKRFTQRTETSLNDLLSFVEHSEPGVRASYSENIKLSKKKFMKMMLLDATFIIELFYRCYYCYEIFDDAKLSQPLLLQKIIQDLLLLENQLPFFFLEGLFNKACPLDLRSNIPSFLELTYDIFEHFNTQNIKPNSDRIKHFTDLLRFFHLPRKRYERDFLADGDNILLYSAKELNEAGVKFKAITSKCLLHLNFSGSILEIPHILVEDETEILFRNMIALDQCHYHYESDITDYVVFMGRLINTENDVNVLIQSKIISNSLGDTSDVAKLISGLRKEVIRYNLNSDYVGICKKLNDFYEDPWHKLKATLRCDYCKTPWQTVASIAGIVLLIFTLIQTIFSILQVELKK